MEQLIIFIIFYVLYALFNRFTKKLKGPPQRQPLPRRPVTQPPGESARPGQRSTTTEPGKPASQPAADEELQELELPPFLQEIFGIDEPPSPPRQEVATYDDLVKEPEDVPLEKPEKGKSISLETFDSKKALKERELKEIKETLKSEGEKSPATPKKQRQLVHSLFKDNQSLKNAFILKEVLDAPVSRRQRKHPYSGRL